MFSRLLAVGLFLFSLRPGFAGAPADSARSETREPLSSTSLLEGRPPLPGLERLFSTPGSFAFGVLSNTPSDTVYLVVRTNPPQPPVWWLIGVERGTITGTQQCTLADDNSGILKADESLWLSGKQGLKIFVALDSAQKLISYSAGYGGPGISGLGFHLPFNLGLRFEPYVLFTSEGTGSNLCFSLVFKIQILSSLSLDTRAGILPSGSSNIELSGLEWGEYLSYVVLSDRYYLTAGYGVLSASGSSHGNTEHVEVYGIAHPFLTVGAGVRVVERLVVDMSYVHQLKKVYGFTATWDPVSGSISSRERVLRGMLKWGFSFYFF